MTTEAIVLRRSDSGESDRRLTLLSPDLGKLDIIAKGARKAGSRLAGSSEPLVCARFHFAAGRHRRYLAQVQPVTSFPALRQDYDRLLAGLALAEVVGHHVPFETPDADLYGWLVASLGQISTHRKPAVALIFALQNLFVQEGHSPSWLNCVVSGERLRLTPATVSSHAGGFVSPAEAGRYGDGFDVPAEALMALDRLAPLEVPPENLRPWFECLRVMARFWEGVLERPLPALQSFVQGVSPVSE